MSYIVEFRIPVFIEVEDEDADDEHFALNYAVNQLDNQSVLTVIEEALEAKTSFGVGDELNGDHVTVNEVAR